MTPAFGTSELRITEPKVARMLLEPATLELLSAFTQQERAAAEIAGALGMPLNSLLYRLKRLLEAGLVTITREESRAGRAVKYYRAVADAFFLPYAVTPAETPEGLLAQEHAGRQARLISSLVAAAREQLEPNGEPVWGVRVGLEDGQLRLRNAIGPDSRWNFLDPAAPAIVDLWAEDISLDFAQAKALQLELCELLGRYRQAQGAGGYILRLALSPKTP